MIEFKIRRKKSSGREWVKSKATSLTGISPANLKSVASKIVDPLSIIFSHSLKSLKFPPQWLDLSLFFIHKKGPRSDPANFRSIAIINPFFKCFTSIIHKRLYEYAEMNNLLPPLQFGFRKYHTTSSAAMLLKDIILSSINKNNKKDPTKRIYACFYDYKSAFDSVDRILLFSKLQLLGIPFEICSLLSSMYSQTKMFIKYSSDCFSEPFLSSVGCPQGDSLSPLLFSLFISDLPSHLKHSAPTLNGSKVPYLLFADDLVCLSDSPQGLKDAIKYVADYSKVNKLVINLQKTKVMVFRKGGYIPPDASFDFPIVRSFIYLGFHFSPQCSFSGHVRTLCIKAKSRVGMLFRKIPVKSLPLSTVLNLFRIYVFPIFHYGIFIWFDSSSPTSKTLIDPVFTGFLKRYLGIPYCSNNALVYYVTGTVPLSHSLQAYVLKSYFRSNFPKLLSGYRAPYFDKMSTPPAPFNPIPSVPSHFWMNPLPVFNKDFTQRQRFYRRFF